MWSFRTIPRISLKLELPRTFFEKFQSHKITNRASILMKIVTMKGLWLFHWRTKFHINILSRLWVIELWNVENRTHTHTHTHTSERQLKIIFLEVLDYSECFDTNISRNEMSTKTLLPQWGRKNINNVKSPIWGESAALGRRTPWANRFFFFKKYESKNLEFFTWRFQ